MKDFPRRPAHFLAALLAALASLQAPLRAGEPAAGIFIPPATLVFLGDSITQHGPYQHIIDLALAARYPGADFWTVNKGWIGQEASHGEARFDWDVMPAKPDVVFIHFGMNDVRRMGYVDWQKPDQAVRDVLAGIYRENLGSLITKATGDGRRVVILSPTPFDHTAERGGFTDGPWLAKELARYTEIAREVAAAHGLPFVDLHSAMRRVTEEMQAKDPESGLTIERVHPTEAGHFVMAWQILRTLDFDPIVFDVELRSDGGVVKSEKAKIAEVQVENGAISWLQRESSFPIPVEQPPMNGLELVPFHDDLNRMLLRVKGLAAGRYKICVDDEPVATHTAAEIAEGVNLAKSPALPHYADLAPLREALYTKKAMREVKLRDVARARAAFRNAGVGEAINWEEPDVEMLQAALDEFADKESVEDKLKKEKLVGKARQIFPILPQLLAENRSERERLAQAPAGSEHRYSILPVE